MTGQPSINGPYGLIENSTWQSNLTPIRYGSASIGDIDSDGDMDMVLVGCLTAGGLDCDGGVRSKIYINNGSTLLENSTWQQNLTGLGWSSTSLGDIDNDGDLDLALVGCTDATSAAGCTGSLLAKIYINNGTTLTANSIWQDNLTGIYDGSIIFGDIDNDGDLDLALNGDTMGGRLAKIYLNNGTSLVESSQWQSNLTATRSGSIAFGDVDNDGDLDLVLSGQDSSLTKTSKIFINNGTTLTENSIWTSELQRVNEGGLFLGDYDNDGDLDLVLIGVGDFLFTYKNNGTTFIEHQKNSGEGGDLGGGLFDGGIAFGDYDNDGDLDFAGMGRESGRNEIYNNNQSKDYNFTRDSTAGSDFKDDNMHNGPLTWIDLDNDNDLDLIAIGTKTATGLLAKVYINNNTVSNTPPNASISGFASSYSDGILNLSWGSANDTETNSSGLYYNLMVGNSTDNHTVVSGVFGGSSSVSEGGGASGYFGNMMQRKNISLNKYLKADTYYWYVQTIDTGLRKSNWSARQSIVIGADTDAPNISSVSSSVASSTATITWTTNESANSTVHYGTTNATTSSSSSDDLVISHSIGLSGLSASTLYYYNVSSCDYWNNCNTSIQYNFTTSATPTNGGSPGGGNGGNGGTTPPVNETIPEFDVDFSTSTTGIFEVEAGDIKTFSFQGEVKHSITTLVVSSNSITLLIASDPITIQVLLGETKQIDMNQDGINDLEINLISIISGKANFLITKLEGADIVGEEELGKDALFDVKVSLSNLFNVVKSGRDIIAQIEVFNVNNIGQVDVLVDYYITSKEDNVTKLVEGSDTLAVEAVASFVRSLTIPYNLKSGKYLFNVDISYGGEVMASGNAEFRVVKSYWIIILVGIIILIVAGIFVYLWKIKRREEKDIGMLKRQISKLKNKEGWVKRMRKNRKRKK